MQSCVDVITYPEGDLQRYQTVSGFLWEDLSFVAPPFSREAFTEMMRLYDTFIVPKFASLYGAVVVFHLPDGLKSPFLFDGFLDRQLSYANGLRALVEKGTLRKEGRSLVFEVGEVEAFFRSLEEAGWLSVSYGEREDEILILPVGDSLGFLSKFSPTPSFACNSHFFLFDGSDCDSPYDTIGTPIGMMAKDGVVLSPPLFGREVLLVKKNRETLVKNIRIEEVPVKVGEVVLRHGENAFYYSRPQYLETPLASKGVDLVVVGRKVVAVSSGGGVRIPMGGFVIHTEETLEDLSVTYLGFEDTLFCIQVGSSCVREGKASRVFHSPFFERGKDKVSYPPTQYPMDYDRDRAPRMAIGADRKGKPLVVFAEGPSKLGYIKGTDSTGASLLEFGEYLSSIGMWNGINMDGGGSAEIFLSGKLTLHVSGRYPDNSDTERPIPMGLMVL